MKETIIDHPKIAGLTISFLLLSLYGVTIYLIITFFYSSNNLLTFLLTIPWVIGYGVGYGTGNATLAYLTWFAEAVVIWAVLYFLTYRLLNSLKKSHQRD